MAAIFIGRTNSGKAIRIEARSCAKPDMDRHFDNFSQREVFDALLAIEYLILCESRRSRDDRNWADALAIVRVLCRDRISINSIEEFRERLGLDSSFALRDYGRSLVRPHFRTL